MKWKSLVPVIFIALLYTGCNDARQLPPNILQVVRPHSPYGIHGYPSFETTVKDTKALQKLYDAAQALTQVPPNAVFNCPVDFGLVYHLNFLHDSDQVQNMELNATGCRFLQIKKGDTRYTTDTFLSLVARTIKVPSLIPKN